MDEKELQKLYEAVSAKFDIGDYKSFKSKMVTGDDRKKFYEAVGEKDFDLGDYNAYESRLSEKKNSVGSSDGQTPGTSDSADIIETRTPVLKQVLNQKPSPLKIQDPNAPQAPVEQPVTPSKVPDFGLTSISQLAKNQRANSDNTASTGVKAAEEHNDIVANAPARTALKKANIKKAVDNTTVKALEAKKVIAPVGSPQYNEQRKKVQTALDNGDAAFALDKDGVPGLKRNVGFIEGLQRGWHGATQANEDADVFVNKMDAKQRLEFYNKLQKENPTPPELIGERPSFAGSAGNFIGGAGPFLGKAGAGVAIGTAAIAAAPESLGASLTGLPVALSFILTAGDMANHAAQGEVLRRFEILKHQHPEVDEVTLMEEAGKGALPGGVGGILTNAILTGGGTAPVSAAGKSVIRKAITSTVKAGLHMGKATAATDLAVQLEGNIVDDVKATPKEMLEHSVNSFVDNATVGAALHGLTMAVTGAANLPKIVQSAFKYSLKNTPLKDISEILHTNEAEGSIPEGTSEKVLADLNGYYEALGKTIEHVDDDTRASVAGLIQKKNNLIAEQKTKDDSFKPVYKEQIDAINLQINEIISSGKPYQYEVDDITGDKLNSREVKEDTPTGITEVAKEEIIPEKVQTEEVVNSDVKEPTEEDFKNAETITSSVDAEQRFNAGERIYGWSEMDEKPYEITSVEDLRKHAPDQLISLKTPEVQKTSEAISHETADKITESGEIAPENLKDIEHLFDNSPYTPEDFDNLKTDLNERQNKGSADGEPEGKQQDPGSTDNTQSSDVVTPQEKAEASSVKDNGSEKGEALKPDNPTTLKPDNSDYTAIKKDVVNEEREAAGKAKLQSTGDGTMDQAEATFAKIKSGEISEEHIRDLTQALAKGEGDFHTNLTPVERQHVLLHDRNTLQVKAKEIDNELIEARATKNEAAKDRLQIKRAQNEALLEANDLAASKTGREWSDVGRARQLLIKQDYTLEALTRKYKAAGDGTIPEHKIAEFRELSKTIAAKDEALLTIQKAQAEADAEIANLTELNAALKAENESFKQMKAEVTAETKAAKRIVKKEDLHKQREQIKANLKDKWNKFSKGQLNAGIPIPVEMIPDLVKLAKNYITEGIVTLDGVVDRVHQDVAAFIDGVEVKTIRDAITGYGKVKKPNTDIIEKTFRDLTAQGRLVSAIEEANEGINPKKSGAQRDEVTKEVRDLKKELNKALKENNIQVVEPEKQMKSALDGAKTRLKNQIEDLTEAISKNQKIEKDHTGINYDAEGKQLQADRDALREEYDEIFGTSKELTDEQRIDRAKKAIKKGIDKLQGKINTGDVSIRKLNTPKSGELEALKKEREELGKVYKKLLETSGELDRRKLEAFKKNIAKRTKYLQEIKDTGNLDKFLTDKVKKKTTLDEEAKTAKASQQKLKNHIDNLIYQREFAAMSPFQRGQYWTGRFTKGVLISNPAVMFRIAGSVAFRAVYKAPTAVVAHLWTKMLPKAISEGAITEAIHTRKDLKDHLGAYYSTLFSKSNYDEMVFAFKNHATKADLLTDKPHKDIPIPKDNLNLVQKGFFKAMELLTKNASAHGAGKSIASNPEQKAYEVTIARNFIRSGVTPETVGEPVFKEMVNQLAYQKSLRAKFMQPNYVQGMQKSAEQGLRQKGLTGTAEVVNSIAPITLISSNYISEAMTKLPGLGTLAARKQIGDLLFGKGSKLTETDKSILLRTLSSQGVGVLSYAIGWMLHSHLAPFFKSDTKKYADKQNEDEEEAWWESLWETMSHSPDALVMQAGATHGWFWQKYDEENEDKDFSTAEFMAKVVYPLASNEQRIAGSSPYFQSGSTVVAPLMGEGDLGKAGANFVKGRIPFSTTASEIAQGKFPVLNKLGVRTGNEEKIKMYEVGLHASGFWDNFKLGVPGWRQEVIKRLFDEKYNTEKGKTDKQLDDEDLKKDAKELKIEEFADKYGLEYEPK